MLIVALILAVIGLAALITAVVTSNEIIAWVCIGASGLGVVLLIIDAIRENFRRPVTAAAVAAAPADLDSTEVIEPVAPVVVDDELDYRTDDFDEEAVEDHAVEDHPDELVHDEPEYDLPTDDEAEFPEPAEEAALHIVSDAAAEEGFGEDAGEDFGEDFADETLGEEDATAEDLAPEDLAPEDLAPEDFAAEGDTTLTEEYPSATVEEHSASEGADSTTEIRYVQSAEGSADTVYTYAETSETEYIEAQDSEATDRGQ